MKKVLKLLIIILLSVLIISCEKSEKEKVKMIAPVGTPLLATYKVGMESNIEITYVNGQDPLLAAFKEGVYDLIIAPINLGAKLYVNNISTYKLDAIITTNNTYLVSKENKKVSDAKVCAFGNGSAPALALNIFLQKNGYTSDVNYKSSVSDVTSLFLSENDDNDYYMTSEPELTKLKEKYIGNINVIEIANQIKEEMPIIIQACLFVKNGSLYDEIKIIKDNIEYLNQNPEEYAKKIAKEHAYLQGLTEETIKNSIPRSNIVYLKGIDYKDEINKYFEVLNKYQSAVLGGKEIDEAFYN